MKLMKMTVAKIRFFSLLRDWAAAIWIGVVASAITLAIFSLVGWVVKEIIMMHGV